LRYCRAENVIKTSHRALLESAAVAANIGRAAGST
jgi:hypothetical protein